MSQDQESINLLARWQSGDEDAAEQIFERYVKRLIGLARTKLSGKMQRRVQPEDIVQSAYRSFFRRARQGDYSLERSGDLWRLLAAITVNKARGQVEYHRAKKRSVDQEASASGSFSKFGVEPREVARDPTPDEAIALVEELEAFLATLEPLERNVLELRLQNQNTEEIAESVQRSTRTVRRILERAQVSLHERLQAG